MSWCTRSGTRPSAASTRGGSGSTSRKLPPRRPQHVELAALGGLDHLGRGEPGRGRHREAPLLAELRRRWSASTGDAAGERGGVGAHLGAALHARVAPDRHEPGAVAPDVAAGQRQVDDGPHAVDRVAVLGDAHRPQQDGRAGRRRTRRRSASTWARRRGRPAASRSSSGWRVERRRPARPSPSVWASMKASSTAPRSMSSLQRGVGEGHVAAGPHRHVEVAHLRAEQRRLGVRRHPVALEPGLEVRVDHDDPGARAAWPGRGTS